MTPSPSNVLGELSGGQLRNFGQGLSIDQIVPSIASAMGAEGFNNSLNLPESNKYVLILVDGLGAEQLAQYSQLAPFLSSAVSVDAVVCNIPSTTATSVTSLGTGARPGEHGIVGYTARVPQTGKRLNILKWDQPLDPLEFQPISTVFERMLASGIAACSVNQAKFANTALTVCSQRGIPFHGVESTYERHDVLLDVIESSPLSMAYGYESRLDSNGHAHGVGSPQWRETLATIDSELAALRSDLPDSCRLLVTADHGMINLSTDGRFDVDAEPRLLDDVTLIAGEARFRHLYTVNDASEAVAAKWRDRLGDGAVVVTRDEAIAADWFGPVAPSVAPRFGDVMVASVGDNAVFSSREFAVEMSMIGFHGSITDAETHIPVLLA